MMAGYSGLILLALCVLGLAAYSLRFGLRGLGIDLSEETRRAARLNGSGRRQKLPSSVPSVTSTTSVTTGMTTATTAMSR